MKSKEEVVQEMQLVVEQMRLDDIEENPDCENEFFIDFLLYHQGAFAQQQVAFLELLLLYFSYLFY